MKLIDTHAHLDLPAGRQVSDLDGWLSRAKEAGVGKIICVGTSIDASKKCIEIAEKHSDEDLEIFASCGIHPEDGKDDIKKYGHSSVILRSEATPESDSGQALRLRSGPIKGREFTESARMTDSLAGCMAELKKVAQSSKKVVAIGECGLDYRLTTDNEQLTTDEEKEFQRKLFKDQIKLAADLNLPLIIHCRNGWDEIFDLLTINDRQSPAVLANAAGLQQSTLKGVFHSWTGDWTAAEKALGLGFYISFSGILTFRNAPLIQEVARKVPLERAVVETDSPFLSPEPLRGKKNEPKNVRITIEFLAELRNTSLEEIADVTARNAEKLFGLS
ncbi:MAG: TatD family hydrolase [Candidatus Curtissbacteria bacterium]|nr:TatD family hydrolase [Candidatus Curtissbacteria bacterium]